MSLQVALHIYMNTVLQVAHLSSTNSTLQRLQFVLELPDKLKSSIEAGRPGQAVEDWGRAELALARYRDMPSFQGIQEECQDIMEGLRSLLRARLADPSTAPEQLQEAVELLRLLGAGSEELCEAFLQHSAAQVRQCTYELLLDFFFTFLVKHNHTATNS